MLFKSLPWRNDKAISVTVSLRAAPTCPLPSETFCYCRQRFLSSAMERSSCHCHCVSSALTNTREPLPGLIPLLTVVTRTMSLLLEQLFLLISFFCCRSHVYASKGSYGRMNRLWFTHIISDSLSRGSFWVSMLHYSPNITKRYLSQQAGEYGLTSRETNRYQSSRSNHGKYCTSMSPLAPSLPAAGKCANALIWDGSCGCRLDLPCCSHLAHNYFCWLWSHQQPWNDLEASALRLPMQPLYHQALGWSSQAGNTPTSQLLSFPTPSLYLPCPSLLDVPTGLSAPPVWPC